MPPAASFTRTLAQTAETLIIALAGGDSVHAARLSRRTDFRLGAGGGHGSAARASGARAGAAGTGRLCADRYPARRRRDPADGERFYRLAGEHRAGDGGRDLHDARDRNLSAHGAWLGPAFGIAGRKPGLDGAGHRAFDRARRQPAADRDRADHAGVAADHRNTRRAGGCSGWWRRRFRSRADRPAARRLPRLALLVAVSCDDRGRSFGACDFRRAFCSAPWSGRDCCTALGVVQAVLPWWIGSASVLVLGAHGRLALCQSDVPPARRAISARPSVRSRCRFRSRRFFVLIVAYFFPVPVRQYRGGVFAGRAGHDDGAGARAASRPGLRGGASRGAFCRHLVLRSRLGRGRSRERRSAIERGGPQPPSLRAKRSNPVCGEAWIASSLCSSR